MSWDETWRSAFANSCSDLEAPPRSVAFFAALGDNDGWAGWGGDTAAMCRKGYSALPRNLRKFMDIITTSTGTPIGIISVGKGRDETIDLRKRRWSI